MKLYGIYNVIDNKSVRLHERKHIRAVKQNFVPGNLIETNRGYFIDGKHVDLKAVALWHAINNGVYTCTLRVEKDQNGRVINKWAELTANRK